MIILTIILALLIILQIRRVYDPVGNPHRARIVQFEFFELFVLSKLDEQFEPSVSRSTVLSPFSTRKRA